MNTGNITPDVNIPGYEGQALNVRDDWKGIQLRELGRHAPAALLIQEALQSKPLATIEDSKRKKVEEYLRSPEAKVYLPALERTAKLIDGFESPLGMELLATVDWLLTERKCKGSVDDMRRGLESWPGGKRAASRKLSLFDKPLLKLALERLMDEGVSAAA